MLKLFFMGTGPFAVPSLEALVSAGHQVLTVVCQPDRPRGRGQALQPPAVKVAAEKLGLPVFQPEKVKDPAAVSQLAALNADLGCVAAFGQILPDALLKAPRLGCVNVHASLLPRYRGAAPIAWAIARGETETGITVQQMVLRLDAGDILVQKKTAILEQDDTDSLTLRLSGLGAQALLETLAGLEAGTLKALPQEESQATLAPLLKKEDALVDFSQDPLQLRNRCRAFKKWPGFVFQMHGTTFKAHEVEPGLAAAGGNPGTLLESTAEGWRIACGSDGSVWVRKIQPPSGKIMTPAEYSRGHKV